MIERWMLDVGVTVLYSAWICDTKNRILLLLVIWQLVVVSTSTVCLVEGIFIHSLLWLN
jgi:hypothetical protein